MRNCLVCKKEYITKSKRKECSIKCIIKNRTKKINCCWIWKNPVYNKNIYPKIMWNRKFFLCHRLSYLEFIGDIPKGKIVCHKCDNPLCVNPDHLWIGTHKENTRDMINKGRQGIFKGEGNSQAKLKEIEILEIRKLFKNGYTRKKLAEIFKVKYSTIVDIILERNWNHVGGGHYSTGN